MELKDEIGNPENSVVNSLWLETQHGILVGVIHRIHPNQTHTTLLFYSNGYVHTATGFTIGSRKMASVGLRNAVGRLQGGHYFPQELIFQTFGTEDDPHVKQALAEGETVHYVFRLSLMLWVVECRGWNAIKGFLETTAQETDHIIEVEDLVEALRNGDS